MGNDKQREIHADISIEIIPSQEEIKLEQERMRRKAFCKKMRVLIALITLATIPLSALFWNLNLYMASFISSSAFFLGIILFYIFYE